MGSLTIQAQTKKDLPKPPVSKEQAKKFCEAAQQAMKGLNDPKLEGLMGKPFVDGAKKDVQKAVDEFCPRWEGV
jgi:hypothetical protein